jgi:hypothetical protein
LGKNTAENPGPTKHEYIHGLERDVQDVFMANLRFADGKLRVTNEWGVSSHLILTHWRLRFSKGDWLLIILALSHHRYKAAVESVLPTASDHTSRIVDICPISAVLAKVIIF